MSSRLKYILLIFISLFPAKLFSEEALQEKDSNNYSEFFYFVTVSTGFEFGDVRELVFQPLNNGDQKVLSEIHWQHLYSSYIEATLNLRYKKFFFDTIIRTAVPSKVGEVYNSDYLIPNSTEKSNFSMHENYLDKSISWQFLGKIPLRLHERWVVLPSIGMSIENKKWSAMHGYKQYSPTYNPYPITEDTPKEPLYGNIISYDQLIIYPIVGIENQIGISEKVIINLGTFIYPYIFISAIDSHYLREKEFKDSLHGFLGIKTTIATTVFPFKNNQDIGLNFSTSYEKYQVRGDTTVSKMGEVTGSNIIGFYKNGAGASNAFFSMALGVSFYPSRQ